jgi:TolA-binding protein
MQIGREWPLDINRNAMHAKARRIRHRVMNRTAAYLGAFLLGIWLFLPSLALQTWGQSSDEEALFSVAAQAYQDGLLDLAHDQLQTYLTTYPGGKHVAEVLYLLGNYSYRKRDFPRAAQALQDALQRQLPEALRTDAQYLLGRSYVETERYAEAIRAFQPLIEPGPKGRWHEAALYWTGEAFLSNGDFSNAAGYLQRLTGDYPGGEYLEHALYSLGYAYQMAEAHEEGLRAFRQLLERFPHSPLRSQAEYGVARTLTALQRFAEAAPHWQDLSNSVSSPARAEEATFWWAESWRRADRCDMARPAFETYLKRFPQGSHRVEALDTVALCAHGAGDVAAEISALEALLQQLPTDPRRAPLLLRLADAYEQSGQLAEAQTRYSHWLLAFPDDPRRLEVLARRGLISRLQGDYAQAVRDFVEVLRGADDPNQRLLAHAVLGEGYFRLDDCATAEPHLSAVIEQSDTPSRQQARLRRAVCAYRNQEFASAVEDFGALVDDAEFRGERHGLLLPLAQSLAALGRDTEAIARFRQYLAGSPAHESAVQALAGLGASLFNSGEVDEALTVYEQLLSLAPTLPGQDRLHLQLALRYRARQAAERAKPHLEAAANSDEPSIAAEALYQLADLLLAEGAAEEATALLQQLTRRFASQPRWVGIASYRLALLYEAAERWPEAWQAYLATAKTATDPKLVEAARERAQHLEETVDVHARREPASAPAEHNL